MFIHFYCSRKYKNKTIKSSINCIYNKNSIYNGFGCLLLLSERAYVPTIRSTEPLSMRVYE